MHLLVLRGVDLGFLSASCSSANMRGGGRAETRDIRRPRSIVKQLGRGVAQAGGAKAGGAEAGAPGLSISAVAVFDGYESTPQQTCTRGGESVNTEQDAGPSMHPDAKG